MLFGRRRLRLGQASECTLDIRETVAVGRITLRQSLLSLAALTWLALKFLEAGFLRSSLLSRFLLLLGGMTAPHLLRTLECPFLEVS